MACSERHHCLWVWRGGSRLRTATRPRIAPPHWKLGGHCWKCRVAIGQSQPDAQFDSESWSPSRRDFGFECKSFLHLLTPVTNILPSSSSSPNTRTKNLTFFCRTRRCSRRPNISQSSKRPVLISTSLKPMPKPLTVRNRQPIPFPV